MSWVKHELKEVGLVTLYFLSCFGIILTLRKLFLADYQIKVYALSAAVVGALMAAKIALLLGHTRAGTRVDVALTHHAKTPLGWHALFNRVASSMSASPGMPGLPCPGERYSEWRG